MLDAMPAIEPVCFLSFIHRALQIAREGHYRAVVRRLQTEPRRARNQRKQDLTIYDDEDLRAAATLLDSVGNSGGGTMEERESRVRARDSPRRGLATITRQQHVSDYIDVVNNPGDISLNVDR